MSSALLPFTAAAAGGAQPGAAAFLIGILPWVLIFLIFYLLMIRPQQKRVKQHQAAISAIKKGDEVVTGGGIRGRVTRVVDDTEAEVEIAQGTRVRVVKSTISQVLTPASTKPAND
ncbi:MAG: Protein translocase subunit YajC [uncultured Sphingomonas sp.]|uniref:Sec translocon accessory complex subunit YajC n=1 Tax=uncultured Sphingomonas sp. TaxID=158754 RepID=A0A6J4SWR1_9SPHN|nr:preprotein translocase subunit YajC [uncultured Sphingomonas sp.]CAA9507086.1 MAG: Protein translocase subunit YajC [uncultured Sphingomonas sp.]